jgi:5-methylcytosine-specific restriction protein A
VNRWPYVPGQLYNRREDIHAPFGGQQQGGISTPSNFRVVFAFTGRTGLKHGYADAYQADGSLHYYGEGQSGDMVMDRGNRAIASHTARGRDLLLFETTGKGQPVKYVGEFVCAGWFNESQPDTAGCPRQAIVFKLVPISAFSNEVVGDAGLTVLGTKEFRALRERAWAASSLPTGVAKEEIVSTVYARSRVIREYALARAGGSCECCGAEAPFLTAAGQPYLEVHHIRRLSDGGPDAPSGVAAICPNCHRRVHFGAEAASLNDKLLEDVSAVERRTFSDYYPSVPAFRRPSA